MCKKRDCAPDYVLYEGSCHLLGSFEPCPDPVSVLSVNPFGEGVCEDDGLLGPRHSSAVSLFVFPCPPGQSYDNEGQCKEVRRVTRVRRRKRKGRNRSVTGKDLVAFLRARFGRQ